MVRVGISPTGCLKCPHTHGAFQTHAKAFVGSTHHTRFESIMRAARTGTLLLRKLTAHAVHAAGVGEFLWGSIGDLKITLRKL